jgi:large subunit ribosomal protein L23
MVKLKEAEKKQATQEASKGKQEKNREAKAKKVDAKSEVKTESVLAKTATLHDLDIIIHPLVTEKAVNMIEAENKLTFIVHDNTSKPEIKRILEKVYGIKVVKVNVIRDMKGRKKAIVKLDKKFKASELATKLGVL